LSPSPVPLEASAPPDLLPARWPPRLYLSFAHLSLFLAFAALALDPRGVGGFFYHPRMLAVVHLVTLGWLSGSILGALYIVLPLAFRVPFPAGRMDHAAFACFAIGTSGVVSHFWIDHPNGMAWSAGTALLPFVYVCGRGLRELPRARLPREVKWPVAFALTNILVAASAGVLLAVNKSVPFLPVSQLPGALAHAHLAALGWATMMVMGAGYRLLPMVFPAAMPRGAWITASALLLQAGALGLFFAFPFAKRLVPLAAVLAIAGIGAFLSRVAWMLRNRRPAPSERPKADASVGHVLQALAYLVLASALGLYLAVAEPSEGTLRLTMAYGVFGLVGFLAQIVIGVEGRVLPMAAWLQGFTRRGYAEEPPSLHAAPSLALALVGLALWGVGVPLLAAGLALDRPVLAGDAAAALALAVVLSAANLLRVLRRLA
jgi:hypothetical protein